MFLPYTLYVFFFFCSVVNFSLLQPSSQPRPLCSSCLFMLYNKHRYGSDLHRGVAVVYSTTVTFNSLILLVAPFLRPPQPSLFESSSGGGSGRSRTCVPEANASEKSETGREGGRIVNARQTRLHYRAAVSESPQRSRRRWQ